MSGLRELKKARTRASLRECALRLFRQQGYAGTTIEQIAAAAEVSPSTFFRYFPTKEDLVLQDDFDVRIFDAFERQPIDMPILPAVRAALRESAATLTQDEWEQLRQASELSVTVTEVRARMLDEMARTIDKLTEAVAKRSGWPVTDLRVRTLSGVLLGVMAVNSMPGKQGCTLGPDVFDRIDEALALLEQGLLAT
jgi:AcrR family transcriptional regulator